MANSLAKYLDARFDHFFARVGTYLYVARKKGWHLELRTDYYQDIVRDLRSTNNSKYRLSTSVPLHTYHDSERSLYHVPYGLEIDPTRSLKRPANAGIIRNGFGLQSNNFATQRKRV